MPRFNRRQFLQSSAAIGTLLASGMGRTTGAASEHIDTPVVDRVVIREITDNQHNIFLAQVQRTGFPAASRARRSKANGGSRCISSRRRAASRDASYSITVSPRMSISTISSC